MLVVYYRHIPVLIKLFECSDFRAVRMAFLQCGSVPSDSLTLHIEFQWSGTILSILNPDIQNSFHFLLSVYICIYFVFTCCNTYLSHYIIRNQYAVKGCTITLNWKMWIPYGSIYMYFTVLHPDMFATLPRIQTNVGLTSPRLVWGYHPTKGSVFRGHKVSGPGRVYSPVGYEGPLLRLYK